MASNDFLPKTCSKFYCEICDYGTSKKSSYDEHLTTTKHQKSMISNDFLPKTCSKYTCDNCCKEYKDNSGLWRHKKKCKLLLSEENTDENVIDNANENNIIVNANNELQEMKEFMKYLMKENSEMKNMMFEVMKNGIGNTNNSHNTTNSHNKAFNLQFFLNETCKEAMNIGEFVDSLKIQLSDLEKVGEKGYIEGITSIIVKNLKELDVTKRPVHCTDKKRETVYIKDNDKWEKDEDKSQMHKLIKRVVSKNMKMFPKYREIHPDCTTYHSKFGDQYQKIIYESMGGKGDDDYEKNEKIIKNILKQVVVNKDE